MRRLHGIAVGKLRAAILDQTLLVGDLILLELPHGARSDIQAAAIERGTASVSCTSGAELPRGARTRRDVPQDQRSPLGTFCIEDGHVLVHLDRDFDPLAEHLGLVVAERATRVAGCWVAP